MLTQRGPSVTRPAARFEKLVVTESGDEVLLYDTDKHHIHHLNATTAAVWRLCDGKHTVVDLAREAGQALDAEVDEATVRLALTKLDDAGLLKESLVDELRMSRMSRRSFMQRAGIAGAIAVPAIVSTTSHAFAEWSQTTCGKPCSTDPECVLESGSVGDCAFCNFGICEESDLAGACGKKCFGGNGDCPGGGQGYDCNHCIDAQGNHNAADGYCGTPTPKQGVCGTTTCSTAADCVSAFPTNSNCTDCVSGVCQQRAFVCGTTPCTISADCAAIPGAGTCTTCANNVCTEPAPFAARSSQMETQAEEPAATETQTATATETQTPPPTETEVPGTEVPPTETQTPPPTEVPGTQVPAGDSDQTVNLNGIENSQGAAGGQGAAGTEVPPTQEPTDTATEPAE